VGSLPPLRGRRGPRACSMTARTSSKDIGSTVSCRRAAVVCRRANPHMTGLKRVDPRGPDGTDTPPPGGSWWQPTQRAPGRRPIFRAGKMGTYHNTDLAGIKGEANLAGTKREANFLRNHLEEVNGGGQLTMKGRFLRG